MNEREKGETNERRRREREVNKAGMRKEDATYDSLDM